MDAAIQKAKVLGITPIVIDAKQEFADLWLSRAIQANSNYEGYPVSTSMTRPQIDSKIASMAGAQKRTSLDLVIDWKTKPLNDSEGNQNNSVLSFARINRIISCFST